MAQIKILNQKHPKYNADRWCRLEALAKGGERFRDYAMEFLPRNPQEPEQRYLCRLNEANYTSYMGSIVNLYVSWLFSASFGIMPYEGGQRKTLDPFYGNLMENVGNETKLTDFFKARFREALTTHKSVWVLEKPSDNGVVPASRAEAEERGLDKVTLNDLDVCNVFDWEYDEQGALLWVKVHTRSLTLGENWNRPRNTVTETWRVYDRYNVTTFSVTYKQTEPPTPDMELTETVAPHGFSQVPVVIMHLPHELAIGEQVADAQLEHFRLANGLSWAIRQTCYAMPIIFCEESDTIKRMGSGYFIQLGKDDKFSWTAPPLAPFDILQKNADSKRNEIYRIVQQMAQGLDNNAETVGRSAESKEIDAAATRILLNAYGSVVSKYIEETLGIITRSRGDVYEWSVEGFSGYDTATVGSLLGNAQVVKEMGIPSATFQREIDTKVAIAMLPEVDHRVKDAIRAEIAGWDYPVTDKTVTEVKMDLMASKAEANRAKADLDEQSVKTSEQGK